MRLMIALLLLLSGYAHANCENNSNDDQRNYCKAKQGRGGCQNIKDDGLRNQCKATTQ